MSPYVLSTIIFVLLAVATGVEYVIGITEPEDLPIFSSTLAPLGFIALIKAGLIVYFYMHVYRLWRVEEDED